MKIGFYDSGLGGLTVLREAMLRIPGKHFIYYGDTKNIPYGEKNDDDVIAYATQAAKYLIGRGVGCIVVACNAASSAAGQMLRESMDIPIICMEPAINLAAKNNQYNKKILVFSTNLTLRLEKYKNLKSKLCYQNIDELATPGLVEFAEQFRTDDIEVRDYLQKNLSVFNLNDYSFVVLGCTHFTFFKDIIQDILPDGVQVIDGNEGTINQLLTVVKNLEDGVDSINTTQIDINLTKGVGNGEICQSIKKYLTLRGNEIICFVEYKE